MKNLKELGRAFLRASDAYAERHRIERGEEWYVLKLSEELGELVQAWVKLSGGGRSNGRTQAELRRALEDETADLFGHVLLFAARNGVDLAAAVERKWRFHPEEREDG